jgi:hypothetical protein
MSLNTSRTTVVAVSFAALVPFVIPLLMLIGGDILWESVRPVSSANGAFVGLLSAILWIVSARNQADELANSAAAVTTAAAVLYNGASIELGKSRFLWGIPLEWAWFWVMTIAGIVVTICALCVVCKAAILDRASPAATSDHPKTPHSMTQVTDTSSSSQCVCGRSRDNALTT